MPDLELSLCTFHVGYLKFEVLELDSLGCNSETGLLEPGSFGSNQAGSGVGSASQKVCEAIFMVIMPIIF